ncbi:MAG: hypothetical protein RJA99_4873 [Pseudomonadota bacterium]|jgi:hypothetical protein
MALQIEQQTRDIGVVRTSIVGERTRVVVRPGDTFRFLDDTGQPLVRAPRMRVRRIDNSLIVDGLPEGREVELNNFFGACRPGAECKVSLDGLGFPGTAPITEETLPTAALQDGSFLLYSDNSDAAAVGGVLAAAKVAEATGPSWLAIGGAGLGIAGAAAAAGGGGGGSSAPDTTPPGAPQITSAPAQKRTSAIVTGDAEAGARVTLRVDVNGNGSFSDPGDLTFVTTAGADGKWRVDLNALPSSGTPPAGGLADGSYALSAVATDAAQNASAAARSVVVLDSVAPASAVISQVAADDVVNRSEATAGVTIAGNGEAGASIRVNWGSTSKTGTVGTDGKWSFVFAANEVPGQGRNDVSVTLTDAAGNSSTVSRAVSIDTLVPGAPTIDTTVTSAERPTLVGSAEAGSSVQVSIDLLGNGSVDAVYRTTADASGRWSLNTATATAVTGSIGAGLTDLQPNTVTAFAVDAAGNASTTTTGTVLRDSRIPPAPTISIIAGDDLVSAAERAAGVTITGTVDPSFANRPVTVTIAGTSKVVTASGTTWSATFASGELPVGDGTADGPYTVQVTVLSVANQPGDPGTRPFTLDTTPPRTPTLSYVDTGVSATDGITGSGVVTVGNLDPGTTLAFSTDGGSTWSSFAGSSFTLTQAGSPYTFGQVQVRQTDAAGNASIGALASPAPGVVTALVVDTTPPAAPTATITDTGTSASDGVTTDGLVTVGNLVGGGTWEYTTDGGTTWLAGTGTSFTLAGGAGATGTTYSVQVRQSDIAGNLGTSALRSITVDAVAPTAPTIALASDTGTSATDTITRIGTVDVTDLEGGTTLWEYSTNAGTTWTAGTGGTIVFSDGAYSVITRQVDLAGNVGASSTTLTFTVDTIAPTVPTTAITDTGTSASDGITSNGLVTVGGLDAGTTWDYSTNNGVSWTAGTGTTFALAQGGPYQVLVRQTDTAGNASTSTLRTVTVDTTAPLAPTLALAADTGSSASDGITTNGTINVTGLEGGSTRWEYSVNAGTSWSTGTGSTIVFATDGARTVIARQVDAAGNTGPDSASVFINRDTVAPTAPSVSFSIVNGSSVAYTDIEGPTGAVPGNPDTSPTVTLTLNSVLAAGETLTLSRDSTVLRTFTSADAAGTTYTASPTLTGGGAVYAYSAIAQDVAGNSRTVDIDGAGLDNVYIIKIA